MIKIGVIDSLVLKLGPIDDSLAVAKIMPLHLAERVYSRIVSHFQASKYQESSIQTRKRLNMHIDPRPSK